MLSETPRNERMERLYLAGKTLQEIGDLFGLTRERVRQILVARGVPSIKLSVRRPKIEEPKRPRGWQFDTPERRRRIAEVCRMYEAGALLKDIIATVDGVKSIMDVYRHLRLGGVTDYRNSVKNPSPKRERTKIWRVPLA